VRATRVVTFDLGTQRVDSGRRPPRHRRAAPRRVDLSRLGAPFSGFADVAVMKRSGSTVASTHRGPSTALGVSPPSIASSAIKKVQGRFQERCHQQQHFDYASHVGCLSSIGRRESLDSVGTYPDIRQIPPPAALFSSPSSMD